TTLVVESAYPGKSCRQSPKFGSHTRHTPTALALATPSPIRSVDTRNRMATEVAPGMPDMPPPYRILPPVPSDSWGTLQPCPHTIYWGHLSQPDTHPARNAVLSVGHFWRAEMGHS